MPRFIVFPGVWLLHHFLTVVTVVWLAAVDALFAEDDERVSTRSQPFERTTEFYACIGMGTYFSIHIFCFELYCVNTSNFIMKKKKKINNHITPISGVTAILKNV